VSFLSLTPALSLGETIVENTLVWGKDRPAPALDMSYIHRMGGREGRRGLRIGKAGGGLGNFRKPEQLEAWVCLEKGIRMEENANQNFNEFGGVGGVTKVGNSKKKNDG